jgi:hypothetical protein
MPKNGPYVDSVCISWKKIVPIDILLISLLVLSTRLATFFHEVLGHAWVALATGGEVHRIKVSLFGGGMVRADLGSDDIAVAVLYCYSGILVNLITGAIPLFFAKKIERANPVWGLFWAIFVMTSLLGSLAYLVLGLYYEFGDPVNWVDVTPRWVALSWIPFLLAAPVAAYIASRLYLSVQQRLIPSRRFVGRLKVAFATLGVSIVVYGGLFCVTDQRLASADAAAASYRREAAKVIEKKKRELAQQMKAAHPELTEAEIQGRVNRTPIRVESAEVPVKFPMVPVVAILFLLGGLIALKPHKGERNAGVKRPKPGTPFVFCLLAAAVIAVLALNGETVWEAKPSHNTSGFLRMEPSEPHFRTQSRVRSLNVVRGETRMAGTGRFARRHLASVGR